MPNEDNRGVPMNTLNSDLLDNYDEELELELEDRTLEHVLVGENIVISDEEKAFRKTYFSELFRLQAELVKLQGWVVESGHKVVILFEGRDAAGKDGAIKRITQRLNPPVSRVAVLPCPLLVSH